MAAKMLGNDEALCLSSQLLTLEQITRSSSVERAEPWYADARALVQNQNAKGEKPERPDAAAAFL